MPNKSLTATMDLLAKANTDNYDIIAIQEPYINFLGNVRSNPGWYSVYPRTHYINRNKRTHSMILISRKMATNSWSTIDIGSPDITAVKVKTQTSSVTIYNLYCDCTHSDSLLDLKRHLQACTKDRENSEEDTEIIWLGDFNRHHPLWDNEQNTHLFTRSNLDKARILMNATIDYNLQIVTNTGEVVHTYTMVDIRKARILIT